MTEPSDYAPQGSAPTPPHDRPYGPLPPAPSGIPVRRSIPLPQSQPRLTYVLLAINIVVFVLDSMVFHGMFTALGAKDNAAILQGQLWRLVTPLFLHDNANLLHIGLNSYSLWIVGPPVERSYGHIRFIAIYLLAGISGVVASFLLSPALSIGASGAIFGLVGALIPLMVRNRGVLANTRQRLTNLAFVIGLNLLIGFAPRIDNWGHIGGLLGGLILGWFTTPRYAVRLDMTGAPERVEDMSSRLQNWVWFGLFGIILSVFVLVPILMQN